MAAGMRKIKGKSPKEMYGSEISKAPEVIYPSVSIPLSALPEAKDWKAGKTYDVTLRIKQTGMHMSKRGNQEHGDASFDIVGVHPHGEAKADAPKRYPRVSK